MPTETDHALMERAGQGDAGAFKELYLRHHQRVYAYLLRKTRDEMSARDLSQEAFVRLWQARNSWQPSGSVAGYLIRVCRRLVIDQDRRNQVQDRWERREAAEPAPLAYAPDDELQQRELRERIAAELNALPERMREVFSLKRDAGLTYQEIAAILGISPKTVDAHLTKALKRLREALSDLR